MSVVTVRPDSTSSSTGISTTGAASLHAALSDNSDSSYGSSGSGSSFTIGWADVTLPGSAAVSQIALRFRFGQATYQTVYNIRLISGAKTLTLPSVTITVGTSPVTVTVGTASTWDDGTSFTDSQLDAIQLSCSTGVVKILEAYLDTYYAADPTVSVTAPTGTITTTNAPVVQWTPTLDSAAGPQTAYEVKIFDDATYLGGGFDPSSSTPDVSTTGTGSATSWTPTTGLIADTYRAYVRVAQTVAGSYVWSAWAYSGFTIGTVANPATPTLTVTGDNANARVQVVVNDNAGDATTDALELQRSVDGGTTWEPMRLVDAVDGVIQGTDTTSYDYESSNGQTVSYRARAIHNVGGGVYTYSDWTATGTGSWTDASNWWLKSPLVPALNTTITVYSFPGYTRTARTGLFQPLGGSKPIATIDTRGSATGQIILLVTTQAEQDALDAILDGGGALLLQPPAGVYWDDKYVAFGDQGRNRLVDKSWIEPTLDTYTWTEIEAPSGNVSAWP